MAEYLSEEDMNTGEYISRDEALKIFHQCCDNCTSSYNGVMCRACADAGAMDILIDMPAADVQPALNEKEYESLCKRMAECVNMGVEDGHIVADDILLEALGKMGYEKLVNLYRDLDKWYA